MAESPRTEREEASPTVNMAARKKRVCLFLFSTKTCVGEVGAMDQPLVFMPLLLPAPPRSTERAHSSVLFTHLSESDPSSVK